jgi:methionyl-tRNA formyltransferase
MKIAFMGSSEFAVASLNGLLHSGHEVLLIVTQPDKPAGRGQKITPCPLASFAQEQNLLLEKPDKLKGNTGFFDKLKTINPDAIVVVAYGKLLPPEILSLSKRGCVNVHSSLLPKYRGAAPINWAIMNGEKNTGVTTMFINERMDEGDILLQCSTEIMPDDTVETLHDHLAAIGVDLLIKTLDRIEKEDLKGVPQDHSKASYARILKKEDGLIDWSFSAATICNKIRGLQPWPKAYTHIPSSAEELLIIFDAAVVEVDTKNAPGVVTGLEGGIMVQTGFGRLCLLEVQLSGKKRMTASDFIKGNKLKVGDKFL